MSFLKDLGQNIGQTVTNAAESVVERSQNLSSQAQLQLSLKKLQLERTRRMQDLGRRTYAWFQSGSLVVSGAVPSDVTDLCRQIDSLTQQLLETQRRLEEVRLEALDANAPDSEPDDAPPPAAPVSTMIVTAPAPDAASGGTSAATGSTPPYSG